MSDSELLTQSWYLPLSRLSFHFQFHSLGLSGSLSDLSTVQQVIYHNRTLSNLLSYSSTARPDRARSPLRRDITLAVLNLEFVVLSYHTPLSPTDTQMLLARSSFLSLNALLAGSSWPRVQIQLLGVHTPRHHRSKHRLGATSLPTPPPLSNLATPKDAAAARDWVARFKGSQIPRAAVDIAFSRSSGPGGQVCLSSCLSPHHIERMMSSRTSIK